MLLFKYTELSTFCDTFYAVTEKTFFTFQEVKAKPDLIFEYVGEKKNIKKVIIDLKKNSTELSSQEIDVINHFSKVCDLQAMHMKATQQRLDLYFLTMIQIKIMQMYW